MQQVKKQLQDAIKELKSEWGINEVKREDLVAVLEKVVAAVERAAQLPVAPVPEPSNFDKYFFKVAVINGENGGYTTDFGNANDNCFPTVVLYQTAPANGELGFFDRTTKILYRKDQYGSTLSQVADGKMFYNRKGIFRVDDSGNVIGTNGQIISGDGLKDDIDDHNWEF